MADEDINIIARRADSLIENHAALLKSLVDLRKKHRLSQAVVAERMGVSQPTVAGFERYDANPTLSTIRRYALAVGARLRTVVVDDCIDERTVEAVAGAAPFVQAAAPPSSLLTVESWTPTPDRARLHV